MEDDAPVIYGLEFQVGPRVPVQRRPWAAAAKDPVPRARPRPAEPPPAPRSAVPGVTWPDSPRAGRRPRACTLPPRLLEAGTLLPPVRSDPVAGQTQEAPADPSPDPTHGRSLDGRAGAPGPRASPAAPLAPVPFALCRPVPAPGPARWVLRTDGGRGGPPR